MVEVETRKNPRTTASAFPARAAGRDSWSFRALVCALVALATSLSACSKAEPEAASQPKTEFASVQQGVGGEVSLLFPTGYVGTVGTNPQKANAISTFSTLNIVRAGFFQSDTDGDGLFSATPQGNDVIGTVRMYFANGTTIAFPASLTWRESSGSTINVFGFIPSDCTTDVAFPAPYSGSIKCKSTAAKSNIGFQNYTTSAGFSFANGENRSGNAASVSSMLSELNAVLSSAPQPSVLSLASASIPEGGGVAFTVNLTSATTTFARIFPFAFTGTATPGADYSTTYVFSNGVTNNGDGTLTVPSGGVSSFTITVSTIDDASPEVSETLTLTVADKSITANIADNDGPIAVTPSGSTLGYVQGAAATVVDSAILVTGGSGSSTSATVAVQKSGSTLAQDVLGCPAPAAITPLSCIVSSGVLTLSGAAANTVYQAALRLVTYLDSVSNNTIDTGLRTVTFTITDANATSASGTRSLQPQAQATVTVTPAGSTADHGVATTFTATLGPSASTGSVQWKIDGVNEGGPVGVASGAAVVGPLTLMPGTYTISAVYGGDAERVGATGSTTFTVAQLNNGVGPCTATNEVAVCVSDACNTVTGTCGGPVNTTCSNANECAGNVCDTGKCGTANGHSVGAGACTTAAAAVVCQSGTCSVNGENCIPASNGCYVDNDCPTAKHCNRSTLSCVDDKANGVAIPNDGLHDGTCSSANAAATCASGQCNTSTNTCAGPNTTTSCTVANECVANVCGSNGKCGTYAGGGTSPGGCTSGTAASVCQSATCSVNGENCIPAAGGCYVDGDCAANQHCNRTTLTCVGDLANGVAIPTDGIRSGACGSPDAVAACLSGQCNATTNTCAGPNTTTTCSYSATATSAPACATNVCGSNGKCGATSGTAGCTAGTALTNCQSGLCSSSSGTCIAAGTCWVDSDCTASQFCRRDTGVCTTDLNAGVSMPSDGLHSSVCNAPDALAVCSTGLCNAVANTCGKPNGQSCAVANQCASNTCTGGVCVPAGGCSVDANCSADKFCNPSTLTCVSDLTAGTALPNDSLHNGVCSASLAAVVCASGQCNSSTNTCSAPNGSACAGASGCTANVCQNSVCGTSNGGSGCTAATAAAVCQSGVCSVNGQNCIPASNGCYVDSDCPTAKHCSRNTLTCVDDKANGVAIPNDGLHDGTCSSANAAATCASGQCNAVTNTCAGPNTTTSCTGAIECVANVCGGNGKCGRPDGSGPCFGAATSCQSGTCNATADGSVSACVPTGAGKCWVDGDCPATDYCARNVFTCKPKESNGTALPADTLHDACATGNVNAACASGRCNPTTNTCGGPNGTTTCAYSATATSAPECITNACGTNGKCGKAEGEAGCTAGTAATVCQSSTCSANSGTCITAGTCWIDADCAANQHCNRNTGACTADKANGVAIPNDGLHTGVCNASNASATCESTGCNATTNTCAGPNTTTSCTTANECVANACGSNGKCGLANGQAGCTSSNVAVCQSSTCSVNGANCIPATNGCYVDGDCAPAKHCDRANLTCVADKADGVAIPNDGLHTGVCNDANALATCVSGNCNAVTNTCASANGAACANASQCVANVCGTNGKCGLADGQSGCSTDAPSKCQSNVCTASGVCLPAGKCWIDSDCDATTQFCARNTNTCTPKGAAGVPVSNDGLHDGACTESNALATCASGKCNADSNTCGDANASSCAQASQCVSNVCFADGACGVPDNQACSSSVECRSGACVDGLCAVPNSEVRGSGGLRCAVATTVAPPDEASPGWLFGLALTVAVSRRRKTRPAHSNEQR